MKTKLWALLLLLLLPSAFATDTATTRLNIMVDANNVTNTTSVWVWTNVSVSPRKCDPPHCDIIIPKLGGSADYDQAIADIRNFLLDSSNDTQDILKDLNRTHTVLVALDGKVVTSTQLNSRMDLLLSDSGIQINTALADQEKRLQKIFSDANATHAKDLQIKDVESRYSLCSNSLTEARKEVERLEGTIDGMNWALGLALFVVLVLAIMVTNSGTPIRRFLNMG
jgi:hypothetical protein